MSFAAIGDNNAGEYSLFDPGHSIGQPNDREEDALLTDNNTIGSNAQAKVSRDRKIFNPNVNHVQYLEDSAGRRADPPTPEMHEDLWRHTQGLRVYTPKEFNDTNRELFLMPGKRYSCYASGIRSTYENKTPYVQKIKVTIPAYHEPSAWNFTADWKTRKEPLFVEITDRDDHVVAQIQQDKNGKLELRGNVKSEAVSMADRRLIAWSLLFVPALNPLDIEGRFSQDNLSRGSGYGVIARMGFEYNCILFGKDRYEQQFEKYGKDGTKFEPSYNFVYDLRSEPASIGDSKTFPSPTSAGHTGKPVGQSTEVAKSVLRNLGENLAYKLMNQLSKGLPKVL